MKTKLNKTEKIIRWASEKKVRGFSHAMTELGYTDEKAFRFILNRLVRNGLITVQFLEGSRGAKFASLRLSLVTYYNRSLMVKPR